MRGFIPGPVENGLSPLDKILLSLVIPRISSGIVDEAMNTNTKSAKAGLKRGLNLLDSVLIVSKVFSAY